MTSEQIAGVVRAGLGAVGGILIALGYIDESTMAAVSGAVVTLVTIGWSIYSNTIEKQVVNVAKSEDVHKVVVSPKLIWATENPKVTTR